MTESKLFFNFSEKYMCFVDVVYVHSILLFLKFFKKF